MKDYFEIISIHWMPALFSGIFIMIILIICAGLRFYKLKRMFDNDSQYEERYENGNLKSKSYLRHIWDLSLFPSLSKSFFRDDWKIAIATYLLLLFLAFYLFTKEQWLAEIIKVNFGLLLGALIGKKA